MMTPEMRASLVPTLKNKRKPAPAVHTKPDTSPVVVEPAGHVERNPVLVYLATLDSQQSRRVMLCALRRILKSLGSPADVKTFPWEKIRYAEAVAVRSALMAKYKPAAVNLSLSALRGVLREAFQLELLTGDEWARVRSVPGVKSTRLPKGRQLSEDELAKLFLACTSSEKGDLGHFWGIGAGSKCQGCGAPRKPAPTSWCPGAKPRSTQQVRDVALLAVLRTTGMRRAEVCALQLASVNLETGELKIVGKGDKERSGYLGQAMPELKAWLEVRGLDPGPLFYSLRPDGRLRRTGLTESGVYDILHRLSELAGLTDLSPHDFRRTFASDLFDANVDLVTVQKLLGHDDPKTSALYDRRGDKTKKAAVELLKIPR